jgi:hypothetical protein
MRNWSIRRPAISRRTVLRGAGVALALPWLESLQSRDARAQALVVPRRFLPIYFPNGAPEFWKPAAVGSGAGWALSSVLEPLAALKGSLTVISGLENGSVFNVDGSDQVEPAHGRQPGAWLTCSDADVIREQLGVFDANGVSVDQLLAAHPSYQGVTALPSLQVGLSTTEDFCDGKPCSLGRSVSWQTQTLPLYKLTDPKLVFQQLLGAGIGDPAPDQGKRLAAHASVLDAVLESAAAVQPKLGAQDKLRMDEFLDSVRALEKRVSTLPAMPSCEPGSEPVFTDLSGGAQFSQNTDVYNRATHADIMNDLVTMAFQCDATRVVSYMLDNEYSLFNFDHVTRRTFTQESSVESVGVCADWHGSQHGSADEYATITWWNVGKVAELCAKLAAIPEGDGGQTILDNTVVFLGSCMHGSNHACSDLPALFVGGGGGRLRTDMHVALGNRPMRDFYYTLMNQVFEMGVTDFGVNRTGAALAPITELLV